MQVSRIQQPFNSLTAPPSYMLYLGQRIDKLDQIYNKMHYDSSKKTKITINLQDYFSKPCFDFTKPESSMQSRPLSQRYSQHNNLRMTRSFTRKIATGLKSSKNQSYNKSFHSSGKRNSIDNKKQKQYQLYRSLKDEKLDNFFLGLRNKSTKKTFKERVSRVALNNNNTIKSKEQRRAQTSGGLLRSGRLWVGRVPSKIVQISQPML